MSRNREDLFVDVLAEPENNFAFTLEKLVLKKSSTNEVFEHIQREYKWFKQELSSKTTRAKNGPGLDHDIEPHWYKVINPVFTEIHRPLNLVSSAMDTSFVAQDFSDSSEDHDVDEEERYNRLDNLDIEDGDQTENAGNQIESSIEDQDNPPTREKSKLVASPHKMPHQIRSNKHGLSAIARAINTSVARQEKRFQRQLKANEERGKSMLDFHALEAEMDRQHELRMAQLFMSQRHLSPPFSAASIIFSWIGHECGINWKDHGSDQFFYIAFSSPS